MKIVICDDNKEDLTSLKNICNELGYNDIVTFQNADSLLNDSNVEAELLFLDIEMEGVDGIELKNRFEFTKQPTFIVFTTSHHELMPEAFGRNVLSFITKPCTKHMVNACIDRAAYMLRDYTKIVTNDNVTLLARDVLYMNAEQKYSIIYTTNNTTYHSRLSISDWSIKLKNIGFCQISRSSLANLKYYRKTVANYIELTDNTKLKISRRYMSRFNESLELYLFNSNL